MRILNLIVTWTEGGIEYEGDRRHVEICMEGLGLDGESKSVSAPIEKERSINGEEEYLEQSESTRYRGIVARMNYLGQDRSDVQYAIKELSSSMSNPTRSAMVKAKRLIRYLLLVPRFVIKLGYQEKPMGITAWSDTDFAGCVNPESRHHPR